MNSAHVLVEVTHLLKLLETYLTLVRTFASVNSGFMSQEPITERKAFSTARHRAAVHSHTLMHRRDVLVEL